MGLAHHPGPVHRRRRNPHAPGRPRRTRRPAGDRPDRGRVRRYTPAAEQTASEGYYRGARYFGALQMLAEPTGRRMAGKWVGFGKDFDVNTGPWELRLLDTSTDKATLASYNRPPEEQ